MTRTVTNIDGIVKTFDTDEKFIEYVKVIYSENEDGQPYPSEIHWMPENIQQATEYIVEYCPDLELNEEPAPYLVNNDLPNMGMPLKEGKGSEGYENMPMWHRDFYTTWNNWAKACFDAGKNERDKQRTEQMAYNAQVTIDTKADNVKLREALNKAKLYLETVYKKDEYLMTAYAIDCIDAALNSIK